MLNCLIICLVAIISTILGAKNRNRVISVLRAATFLISCPFLIGKGIERKNAGKRWFLERPLMWAHAGGGYPVLYGNAQENFDTAIAKGFRCLEADVQVTLDGVPVMSHMFRPNNENLYERTPLLEEFLAARIDDKYTPLTLKQFVDRYRHFDGWIFLDGISFGGKNRVDFREFFSTVDDSFRQKLIVQIFKFKDLIALKHDNPFGGIHFSGLSGIGTNALLRPLLIRALKTVGVESVSISDWEIKGANLKQMVEDFRKNGFVVSVAGVNTISYYKRLRAIGVNCIDTDFLSPKDLEGIE